MGFFAALHHYDDLALLVLRLALGAVFLAHGLPKRAMWSAQPSAQLPASMLRTLRMLSIAEPAGAVAVIFGFLTQLAALGFVIDMLAAIQLLVTKVHRKFKEQNAAGWEFELMLLVAALALVIMGGGKYALDRVIFGI